ncbi:simple sugar transport system permease protein [Mycoplasma testudineum]|uniref:Simple sugar transport system permease protein n=1 Tax=Mycoplasma testudineum TaxID=244584 RepID=A0A4R6IE35_9MOLU|nr:ABC transporter permease [Mycoplasma testudineum]OYD26751.1 sugar ABC transporter permease [Mycoplasma testudineum]TDO19887.1 simple sugar transport system permease protein [Mycoplasma testudineum]
MISQIFVFAFAIVTVLGIASISGIFSERVGILNIGIDGMMVFGATIYGMLAMIVNFEVGTNNLSGMIFMQLPLLFLAAILTAILSSIHGLITIKLKGNHIISGIAINLLATGFAWIILITVPTLVSTTLTPKTFGTTGLVELALVVSSTGSDFGNLVSLKLFLFVIIAIASWFVLTKTKWGLRFKSIGENPQAADVAGINVNSYKWQGVLISGFLAGIAGSIAIQLFGISTFSGGVRGFGFLALAIMIMSQWKISWSVVVSMGFAIIYSLANSASSNSATAGPIYLMIPYIISIFLLVFFSRNTKAPKAAGIPYEKSAR